MDEAAGRELLDEMHGLLREMERSRGGHDRRGQRARVRRRLRAGDGLRRPDRRASRRASASPRSTSGSSPASAGPSGCRGWSARASALEMNLIGEPIRPRSRPTSSGSSTASSPTTSCSTPRSRGRASSPARRRSRSSRSSACRRPATSTPGIEAEKKGVRRRCSGQTTRARGSPRSSQKRKPTFTRHVTPTTAASTPAARRADRQRRLGRRADRRRDLGPVRDPRLPLARHRAVGERRPDGGRPHRRAFAPRPGRFWQLLRRRASRRSRTSSPTAPTTRSPSSSGPGCSTP